MATNTIYANDAKRQKPGASCSVCGKSAREAPAQQSWYIGDHKRLYCSSCAVKIGIK